MSVAERGANGQSLDRRLFMQFLAFTGCGDTQSVVEAVKSSEGSAIDAVVYESATDPTGVAVAFAHEDPGFFIDSVRPLIQGPGFEGAGLIPQPEFTMFGRSYSIGYEPDLEETVIHRPKRHLFHPDWPWAIWYPLRRKGSFEQLSRDEQMAILKEHGEIGMRFGRSGLAYDIRLACHGLDASDNDFIIGLMGKQLHPLSAIVQTMRKTKQTSTHLEQLGPFWVGRAVYKSPVQTPPPPAHGSHGAPAPGAPRKGLEGSADAPGRG